MEISYINLFKGLKLGSIDSLYLFYGEEDYLIEQSINIIIEKIIGSKDEVFDLTYLDGNDISMEKLVTACDTFPMLNDRRLVILKKFSGFKNNALPSDNLVEYIAKIQETTCLVVITNDKPDKRKALYKAFKENGIIVNFEQLKNNELRKFALSGFKKYKKNLDRNALDNFIYLSNHNLRIIKSDIEKICNYAGERTIIDINDIDKLVGYSFTQSIFDMVEAIGNRNAGKTITIYNGLIGEGQSFYQIMPMIIRQIRQIMKYKVYKNKLTNKSILAKEIGVPPFVLNKLNKQEIAFSLDNLKKAVELCNDTDNKLKNGIIQDSQIGMELLLVKLCNI